MNLGTLIEVLLVSTNALLVTMYVFTLYKNFIGTKYSAVMTVTVLLLTSCMFNIALAFLIKPIDAAMDRGQVRTVITLCDVFHAFSFVADSCFAVAHWMLAFYYRKVS